MNSARLCVERTNGAVHRVSDVNEITFLLAVLKNARSLAGLYLLSQVINHACGHALVRFTRSVNVEVTQPDDDPVRRLNCSLSDDVIHYDLGKCVNVRRRGTV